MNKYVARVPINYERINIGHKNTNTNTHIHTHIHSNNKNILKPYKQTQIVHTYLFLYFALLFLSSICSIDSFPTLLMQVR